VELNALLLGRCEYDKALDLQYEILEKRQRSEIADTLILVEHPPVITLGRQALAANIIATERYIKDQGIGTYHTNRGGDVTYHGYGQVVGYPIVNLKERGMGIREFVGSLEDTFIQLLKEKFEIQASKNPDHTGVWVGNDKITAIGLAVKKGVTMHGFAFNVNTCLEHFNLIVPCGLSDKGVTSVERIMKQSIDFQTVNQWVLQYFTRVFGYDGYRILSCNK